MSEPPLIAIVDDDEEVCEALSDLLRVTGFACRCFTGAEAFLENGAAANYDCVVTDVRMPVIDGIELQRRLRAEGSRVPFIFITSHRDPVTRRRALDAGAHAYLSKPVSGKILLAHLRSALDGERSPRGTEA